MNKIIHQIWVGPNEMPVRERRCSRLVKSKNSSWEYMFWNDTNVPKLPKDMQEIYDFLGKAKQYTFQADILRLFVVKEYGGLYVDVDFEPHTSFDGIEELDNLFLTWGLNQKRLFNGAFGAEKDHIVINDLCSKVNIKTKFYGPDWYGDNIFPHSVNLMSFNDFQKKYAFHHHLNSWGT